ncbi:hypothetical protein VTN77DRAFT_3782 [Rasamsonia byssochlamydoides]|uniref:uncharacterized protein n=1 Tax=Rasamsonia byssochlamydoides TaxID=89139 RepID=UPI003743C11D
MAAQLASFVGRRILKETAMNKFGQEDPYFEQVPASRLARAFGKKTTRRRKAIPPGLSENDAKILNRVKRRAYHLDYALCNFCGIRFGWGSVIGLLPFAGDGLDAGLAMMVARDCQNIDGGLPPQLYSRMMLNIVIDFVIGLIPFVGDLADAIYKCNTRNAILLEKYLREKAAKQDNARLKNERHERQQRPVDLSIPEEFDRYDEGTLEDPQSYQAVSAAEPAPHASGPTRQPPVRGAPDNHRDRGWFGGQKQKQGDLETGVVRYT